LVAFTFLLSACASNDKPRGASHLPRPSGSGRTVTPAVSGRTSASVWKLRAGLNVAALSCRGRGKAHVAGEYRKLLSRHRALLALAYKAEERRLGRSGLDRQQTRIYNRFSNQRSPQRFCQAASDLAKRANRMDSSSLAPASRGMALELERRLR
jgi:hypothetical protein